MRVVLMMVAVGLLAVGCDRTHMSASYGRANRTAFAKQVVDPGAGAKAKSTSGLDPESSAAVYMQPWVGVTRSTSIPSLPAEYSQSRSQYELASCIAAMSLSTM